MGELTRVSTIRLKCAHTFHKNCIISWINTFTESKPTCPICRACLCYISPQLIECVNFAGLKLTEIRFFQSHVFSQIHTVDISDNLISELDLSSFDKITELDIRKNSLKSVQLPTSIRTLFIDAVDLNKLIEGERLYNLTDLTIQNLNNEEMLRGIDIFSSVKTLEIINNSVINLNLLSKMKDLEEITVKNTVKFGLGFLSNLTHMRSVEIDTSDFDTLELSEPNNITSLTVFGSKISDIDFLTYFPNLKKLNLGNNLISEFNNKNCTELSFLNLENNFIIDTSFLQSFKRLEYLNIGNNLIVNLDSIRLLLNLEIFKCHGNLLSENSVRNVREHVNFEDGEWL
jgi:hypothetical protein